MCRWAKYLERVFNEANKKPVSFGLENVIRVHEMVGRPGEGIPVIHVTGTNGKGTFCTKTALAMQLKGIKTGLFTSPHISTIRERTRVNGEMISKEFTMNFYDRLLEMGEQIGETLTYFDYQTVQALAYFKEKKVDAIVLEVGMGGRLDSTNLLPTCLSAVVTDIDLDHTEVLGNTREDILREKMGIVKRRTRVVVGPRVPRELAQRMCRSKGSMLYVQEKTYDNYVQEIDALVRLNAETIQFDLDFVDKVKDVEGAKCMPPCRLQPLELSSPQCTAYLDVGHNPAAIERVLKTLQDKHSDSKLYLFFGCKPTKDASSLKAIFESYSPFIEKLQWTSLDQEEIRKCLTSFLEIMRNDGGSSTKKILLIGGSFHMMSPAINVLSPQLSTETLAKLPIESDTLDMNNTYRLK